MTVQTVAPQEFRRLVGLSTDPKPTSDIKPGEELWEADTDQTYRWSGSEWQLTQLINRKQAGERQEDATNGADHMAVAGEWAISAAIDLSNNESTTVYDGPAILGGIWVEVTIGTAAITIDDESTARMTVPVAIPIGMHDLKGIIFEGSLIVNPADASTGTIRVLYRPLDPGVTWAY